MNPLPNPQSLSLLPTTSAAVAPTATFHNPLLLSHSGPRLPRAFTTSTTTTYRCFHRLSGPRISLVATNSASLTANPPSGGVHTVGDFMTGKDDLHVVKPTTTVDEALDIIVENRITGFPVIDDDWKLVGLVSDYDLLALDSISGMGRVTDRWCTDYTNMFPEVDSTWRAFNKVQNLLSKTNGQVVGDLMTPAPMVVHESTNLEDAARLLLETKYRRLPVVDGEGKLVGIITRGNVVRAALQMKRDSEIKA